MIAGTNNALEEREKRQALFKKKGIVFGVASGMVYGLYAAFLSLGLSQGVWSDWSQGIGVTFSDFIKIYALACLASSLSEVFSAIYVLLKTVTKGLFFDFVRSLKTKPGKIVMCAAIVGAPLGATCYLMAFQVAGPIIIPVAALSPVVGAILSRILFKQKLTFRILFGIFVCIFACSLIGMQGVGVDATPNLLLGAVLAFACATLWGIEGCICGYATVIVDYRIAITIRQIVCAIVNLFVIFPILCAVGGDIKIAPQLAIEAFTDLPFVFIFILCGVLKAANSAYWYKGNGMCGTALGMACNSAYAFWGPFFTWILLGVFIGYDGFALPAIAWVAAILIVIGIIIISLNPKELHLKRK